VRRRNAAVRDETDDDDAVSPLRDVLGFQLRRAHMLFAEHWQRSFRDQPVRVTPMLGGMLLSLESRPGLTQVALARLMDVEGPTLMQALDKLEGSDLVRRSRRADDRRSYALHLTEAGQRAVADVKRYVPHREAELLTDLSDEERRLLLDLLKRVVRRGHDVLDMMDVSCGLPQAAAKVETQ
jgi:DNA-binding MarR family transcriptional regulator